MTNANLIARFDEAEERFEKAREAGDYYRVMTEAERMLALAHDIASDNEIEGDVYRRSAFEAMGQYHQMRTERSLSR